METQQIVLIVILVLIMLAFALFRKRGGPLKYPEIVQALIINVRVNIVICDNLPISEKPKTFECNNWILNKDKIGFLTESQKELLTNTFNTIIEEMNPKIRAAKKEKSDSYKNLNLSELKTNLEKCRDELEGWMMKTIGKKALPPKYPSVASMFLGDR